MKRGEKQQTTTDEAVSLSASPEPLEQALDMAVQTLGYELVKLRNLSVGSMKPLEGPIARMLGEYAATLSRIIVNRDTMRRAALMQPPAAAGDTTAADAWAREAIKSMPRARISAENTASERGDQAGATNAVPQRRSA